MIPKFVALLRHPADAWNYLFATTGLAAVFKGLLDANAIQVWCGAFVAVAAILWGFLRDQRRHDKIEAHAEEQRQLNIEWQKWAVGYRQKKLEETGVDPFRDGIPALSPFAETKEPASN